MATIFTATPTNAGFYMVLVTAAADAQAARAAFEPMLSEPDGEDVGGDYTLGDVVAIEADEDGDYDLEGNMGGARLADPAAIVAELLSSPGKVVTLHSGANG